MMKANTSGSQRQNRTVTLHLGNTLEEYEKMYLKAGGTERLLQRIEIADSFDWGRLGDGHKETCTRLLNFTYHGSYIRTAKHFDGGKSPVTIQRVRCLDCGAVFSVQPSFIIRYKRYETDAVEKFMTLLFITEDSYRMAGVSQIFGMDEAQNGTWEALETNQIDAVAPMVLWRLVQWFGQLSPAQLNLALGVEPPAYIIEDEKHAKQAGEKGYIPMIYAPKEALIWWIDYLNSATEDALRQSFERFKAISERLHHILGATVDGWDGAQNALRSAFPNILLEECHFHIMLKLGTHLATYKRLRKKDGNPVSEQEESDLRLAVWNVLKAESPEDYQKALDDLPEAFEHPILASRKASLIAKQAKLQAWLDDDNLAVVTTPLDQSMKFLKRKLKNMQTFRTPNSALASVNAWAITRNCWRFLDGAKRAGLAPLELAGADFLRIPWLQIVNLLNSAWPYSLSFSLSATTST